MYLNYKIINGRARFESAAFPAFLCCALVPLLYFIFFLDFSYSSGSGVLWLDFIVSIFLVFLCVISSKNCASLFLVCTYLALFYLGPGLMHVHIGVFPFFGSMYGPDEIQDAALVVFVFLIFFTLAYFKVVHRRRLGVTESSSNLSSPTTKDLLLVVSLCIAGALLMSSAIGFDLLLQERGEFTDADLLSPSQLIFLNSARVLGFLAFAYSIAYFRNSAGLYRYLNP